MNLLNNKAGSSNNNHMLNKSLAFLGGVTIGSVATLLFAPKKGSESRKQVMDKFNDVTSRINGKMNGDNKPKATMAALPTEEENQHTSSARTSRAKQQSEDAPSSKAQSMISHLKHTKKDNSVDYVD